MVVEVGGRRLGEGTRVSGGFLMNWEGLRELGKQAHEARQGTGRTRVAEENWLRKRRGWR